MVPADRVDPTADPEVTPDRDLVAEDPEAVRDREGRAAEEWAVARAVVDPVAVMAPVGAAEPYHICS